MNRPPGHGPADGGFATVWAASAIAALLVLTVFAVHLGAAVVHRHRAEAAADLAALAAAAHAIDSEPVACAHALRVTEPMTARMTTCRVTGWEATVEVEVIPSVDLPWSGIARGRARAGPATGTEG